MRGVLERGTVIINSEANRFLVSCWIVLEEASGRWGGVRYLDHNVIYSV